MHDLLALPADTPTRYKSQPGGQRRLAWTEPLPLTEVKRAALAAGATVNDVLLSCAAAALRAHLLDCGDPLPPDARLRAMVPINLTPTRRAGAPGNEFGLAALELPLGSMGPAERLRQLCLGTAALRNPRLPTLSYGLLGRAAALSPTAPGAAGNALGAAVSAVMASVPGPRAKRYLAGAGVEQMVFWAPQISGTGLAVSLVTYDGKVQFGIAADSAGVRDPQAVVAMFAPQLHALLVDLPAALAAADIGQAPAAPAKTASPRPARRKAAPRRAKAAAETLVAVAHPAAAAPANAHKTATRRASAAPRGQSSATQAERADAPDRRGGNVYALFPRLLPPGKPRRPGGPR
ncbi:MAG: DUF1298 domain-containing protein [Rhodocyclaceae bacterium]|nr:DUF1298 domain-containing protein [Rhodocyclaceae bacterium]